MKTFNKNVKKYNKDMITRTTDTQAGLKRYYEEKKAHLERFRRSRKVVVPVNNDPDHLADLCILDKNET